MDEHLLQAISRLVEISDIIIDRKKGTVHPRYDDVIYPLDYGYLENTSTTDGKGIDIWRGSDGTTVLSAIVCTCDLYKRDLEFKLLIGCDQSDIKTILKHHNQGDMTASVVWSSF